MNHITMSLSLLHALAILDTTNIDRTLWRSNVACVVDVEAKLVSIETEVQGKEYHS